MFCQTQFVCASYMCFLQHSPFLLEFRNEKLICLLCRCSVALLKYVEDTLGKVWSQICCWCVAFCVSKTLGARNEERLDGVWFSGFCKSNVFCERSLHFFLLQKLQTIMNWWCLAISLFQLFTWNCAFFPDFTCRSLAFWRLKMMLSRVLFALCGVSKNHIGFCRVHSENRQQLTPLQRKRNYWNCSCIKAVFVEDQSSGNLNRCKMQVACQCWTQAKGKSYQSHHWEWLN